MTTRTDSPSGLPRGGGSGSSGVPPGLLLSPSSEDDDLSHYDSSSPTASSSCRKTLLSSASSSAPRKPKRSQPRYSPAVTFASWKSPLRSSPSYGGGGGGKSRARTFSGEDERDVLPTSSYPSATGVVGPGAGVTPDAKLGLSMRRMMLRDGWTSPFGTPRKKLMDTSTLDGHGSAVNTAQFPSGGSSWRRIASALCALSALILASWILFSGGSGGPTVVDRPAASSASSPPLPPFRFRPSPVLGSDSERAAQLFRESFGTSASFADGTEEGELSNDGPTMMKSDDPRHPGSIFVVADLRDDDGLRGSGSGRGDGADMDNVRAAGKSVLDDDDLRSFALGMGPYLEGKIRSLVKSMDLDHIPDSATEEGRDGDNFVWIEGVDSYYSLDTRNLGHVGRAEYTTPDGRSALMEVKFSIPPLVKKDKTDEIDEEEEDGSDDSEEELLLRYISSVAGFLQDYGRSNGPSGVDLTYAGLPLIRLDLAFSDDEKAEFGSLTDLLPPGSSSVEGYRTLSERFGWGRIAPYKIAFQSKNEEGSALSDEAFRVMQRVLSALEGVDAASVETTEELYEDEEEATLVRSAAVNLDSIPQRIEDGHMAEHLAEVMDELFPADHADAALFGRLRGRRLLLRPHSRTYYDGVAFLRNNPVPFPLLVGSELCAKKNGGTCPIELLNLFDTAAQELTSDDGRATYVTATLGTDPFSEAGVRWLRAAREKLRELREDETVMGDYEAVIVGGAALEYDAWTRGAEQQEDDGEASSFASNGGGRDGGEEDDELAAVFSSPALAWGAVVFLLGLAYALSATSRSSSSSPSPHERIVCLGGSSRPAANHYNKKM